MSLVVQRHPTSGVKFALCHIFRAALPSYARVFILRCLKIEPWSPIIYHTHSGVCVRSLDPDANSGAYDLSLWDCSNVAERVEHWWEQVALDRDLHPSDVRQARAATVLGSHTDLEDEGRDW